MSAIYTLDKKLSQTEHNNKADRRNLPGVDHFAKQQKFKMLITFKTLQQKAFKIEIEETEKVNFCVLL